MSKVVTGGYEYAMVPMNAGHEALREFVGYREGMELDWDGQILAAGRFVPGSNNGWHMASAIGGIQVYVRKAS